MKKNIAVRIFLILISSTIIFSCKKDEPTGNITFWISYDNGCGPISVSIDGGGTGTITNWQAFSPSNCTGSNTILTIPTKQGSKNVTFKNNCKTWKATIPLNSDCYIYNVF
jgi:hypothetical protein